MKFGFVCILMLSLFVVMVVLELFYRNPLY